jgi:hypothetical protein
LAAFEAKGLKYNLSTCRLEGLHSRAFGCFQVYQQGALFLAAFEAKEIEIHHRNLTKYEAFLQIIFVKAFSMHNLVFVVMIKAGHPIILIIDNTVHK